jgi:hypothetical protein
MLKVALLLARVLVGAAVLCSAPALAGSPLTNGPSPSWGYGYEVPAYVYPYGYLGYRHGRATYSVFGYVAPEELIETSPFLYFGPRVRLVRRGRFGEPHAYVPDLFRPRWP